MTGFANLRRWAWMLLILGGLAGSPGPAPAGDPLRLEQNLPGDSTPIVLHADEITTWTENGRRVILLKGTVLVEQGVVHARMKGGVVWIDPERKRQTGVLHVDLLAEGDVHLEKGAEHQVGTLAFVELNTRGEVKLRAQQNKIGQQPRPDDPLYRRALAAVPAAAPPTPPPGLPGPGLPPGISPAPAPLAPVGFSQPAGTTAPLPPGPPPAPAGVPAPPWISTPPGQIPASPPGNPPPAATQMRPAVRGAAPADEGAPPADGPGPPAPTAVGGPAAPGPPPPAPAPPAAAPAPPSPAASLHQLQISPRYLAPIQYKTVTLRGEQALLITGGVILTVRGVGSGATGGLIDMEADVVVIWSRGGLQQLFGGLRSENGEVTREAEVYLAGNVELRSQNGPNVRTLRADEIYYDIGRNVAVARDGDLEFRQKGLPDPIHFRADEIQQLSPDRFKGLRGDIFSSRLPSDPGLRIYFPEADLENRVVPRRSIFGMQFINRETGQPETARESIVTGRNVLVELENIPIFYLPFIQGDANDPLGPLTAVNFDYNKIFGFRVGATFNLYDLLGMDPLPGTHWKLNLDYLSMRGPAAGTDFDYAGKDLFGLPGTYIGSIKAWGISDTGTDQLGGGRGSDDNHPVDRGRFFWRHYQELPDDFTLQGQVSALSDKNFLEQYYKIEFDQEYNQETFLYLKQQRGDWAWTVLTEPYLRSWVNETEWLPKADGYLIGQLLFDRLSYSAHASAGYGRLRTTDEPPPPLEPTTKDDSTVRLDLWQELSYPFTLGPIRVVPYAVLDLAYYSNDLADSERGRIYEAGGVRASMPLTRLYPNIQSDFLNLNGINHKIVLSANYYIAHSDVPFTQLPQLDRLNDDATDQALRDIRPIQPLINPAHGLQLATLPLYDPQTFAIRRLVDSRVDTLDSIEVLEMDIRQRWQTKRGYPGQQHIVDWMTLDVSANYYPDKDRDNFGHSFAFVQYDWVWNIGDRTALTSTGWVDPIGSEGAHVFTVGLFFNRPDRTNVYLGFRETDPLNSTQGIASVTYVFSPKYSMTGNISYDFANHIQTNSLVLTRMGSDLQMSLGVSYNSTLSTLGVTFEVLPNLLPQNARVPGIASLGTSTFSKQ